MTWNDRPIYIYNYIYIYPIVTRPVALDFDMDEISLCSEPESLADFEGQSVHQLSQSSVPDQSFAFIFVDGTRSDCNIRQPHSSNTSLDFTLRVQFLLFGRQSSYQGCQMSTSPKL